MMTYKKSAYKKGAFLLLMILFIFFAGSCSTESQKSNQEAETQKEETYVNPAMFNSDILRIGLPEINRVPTPYDAVGTTENSIIELLYEGLFKVNEMGVVEPNLAQNYTFDSNKNEILIELRDDVRFHDGTPLKAEHVYNVYYFLKGIYAEKDFFNHLLEMEVLDDHRLVFTFSKFSYEDFNALTMPIYYFASPNYSEDEVALYDYKSTLMPQGTGPFILNTQEKNVWTFVQNPLYTDNNKAFNTIKIITLSDAERLEGLKNGTLDLAYLNPQLESEKQLREKPYLSAHEVTSDFLVTLGMNLSHPLFGEKKFRQALQYGINKKSWTNLVWPIGSEVAYAPVPKSNPFYPKDQALNDYKYDPVKASALLDELGFKYDEESKKRYYDEKPIVLYLDTFSEVTWAHKLALQLKENLNQLGIQLIVNKMDFEALNKKVFEDKKSDFYVMGWELPVLSNQGSLFGASGKFNAGGYSSPVSENLFATLDATFESNLRQTLMTQWIVEANEDLPWIFLAYRGELWGVNERVEGFKVGTYSSWTSYIKDWKLVKS